MTTGASEDEDRGDRAQHHRDQQQQGRGEAEGLLVLLAAEQFGEDRDEGRLQGGVGEQGADQVRDLEGDREGRHRPVRPRSSRRRRLRGRGRRPARRRWRSRRRRSSGAIRPPPGPRAGSADEFLARVEGLGLARPPTSALMALQSCVGVSGVLGVSKLQFSVAIVGGRPGPARRPPQALDHGQHSLTEEADPTQRARAHREPAAHQHGEDPLPPPRERGRGRRRRRRSRTSSATLVSKIDKAVQKGAMHKNTGARKKSKARPHAASPPPA